jgi:hypothetical protein
MGLGLLEPLIYHGFCDLERQWVVEQQLLLAQLPSMIASIATESSLTQCTPDFWVSCEWAASCNRALGFALAGQPMAAVST